MGITFIYKIIKLLK